MNDYQREQWDALVQIMEKTGFIDATHDSADSPDIESYILYRQELDVFSARHFSDYCTQACFESRTSACCSKDGIITFWADMVINVWHSARHQIDGLFEAIKKPLFPNKCIYLGENGCRWQVRPLGCALFLCDGVHNGVLRQQPDLGTQWDYYQQIGRRYRWPDRPVLFDRLEQVFMAAGCHSPLMYINTSPGLMRIKQKAGLLQE